MKNYRYTVTCKYDEETGKVHDAVVKDEQNGLTLIESEGKTLDTFATDVKRFIVDTPNRPDK